MTDFLSTIGPFAWLAVPLGIALPTVVAFALDNQKLRGNGAGKGGKKAAPAASDAPTWAQKWAALLRESVKEGQTKVQAALWAVTVVGTVAAWMLRGNGVMSSVFALASLATFYGSMVYGHAAQVAHRKTIDPVNDFIIEHLRLPSVKGTPPTGGLFATFRRKNAPGRRAPVGNITWGNDGLPTAFTVSITPARVAKMKDADKANLAAGIRDVLGTAGPWRLTWNPSTGTADAELLEERDPAQDAVLERMFDYCKANLSWQKDLSFNLVDSYITVDEWFYDEEGNVLPKTFTIKISSVDGSNKDAVEREEFGKDLSQAITDTYEWFLTWRSNSAPPHISAVVAPPLPGAKKPNPMPFLPIPALEYLASLPDITGNEDLSRFEGNVEDIPIGIYRGGEMAFIRFRDGYPHGLVAGATGGGKSASMNVLLTHLLARPDLWDIILVDPKAVDFSYCDEFQSINGEGNILSIHRRVGRDSQTLTDGVMATEDIMIQRQEEMTKARVKEYVLIPPENGLPRRRLMMVVDEAANFLTMEDAGRDDDEAKERNRARAEAKRGIGAIAELGRAMGVHELVATQVARADTFSDTTRKNLGNRLALGRMDDGNGSEMALGTGSTQAKRTPQGVPGRGYLKTIDGLREFHAYYIDETTISSTVRRIMTLRGIDLRDYFPEYDGPPGNREFPLTMRAALLREEVARSQALGFLDPPDPDSLPQDAHVDDDPMVVSSPGVVTVTRTRRTLGERPPVNPAPIVVASEASSSGSSPREDHDPLLDIEL